MGRSGQKSMTGKFIVFEGADGCGKTTQLRRFYDWLQAKTFPSAGDAWPESSKIWLTKEPGATPLGKTLRQILLTPTDAGDGVLPTAELLLYAADRAQHVQQVLKPKLSQGHWIVCDRHVDSTVAYQGFGRGLDRALIENLNSIATAGLVSNLTLWLDLPMELSQARRAHRGEADRMEQLDIAFHRRVYEGFASLAAQHPERIVRVDANGSEDEVAERIQRIVIERFFSE